MICNLMMTVYPACIWTDGEKLMLTRYFLYLFADLQVLVTGSLHLVGDVLKLLKR